MVTISPGEKILQGVIVIKVWFLMALMSYPNINAIHYKGFGGFTSLEECEEKRILTENGIAEMEMSRGTPAVYIETYCMEFDAFPSQFDAPRRNPPTNPAEFGV
jgi:hypothetical protein